MRTACESANDKTQASEKDRELDYQNLAHTGSQGSGTLSSRLHRNTGQTRNNQDPGRGAWGTVWGTVGDSPGNPAPGWNQERESGKPVDSVLWLDPLERRLKELADLLINWGHDDTVIVRITAFIHSDDHKTQFNNQSGAVYVWCHQGLMLESS